jgi:hypothetical protein
MKMYARKAASEGIVYNAYETCFIKTSFTLIFYCVSLSAAVFSSSILRSSRDLCVQYSCSLQLFFVGLI